MITPNWLKPHDQFYDQYSIEISDFIIPEHFDVFNPDDGDELGCKTILMPSPRKSSINYIKHNKFQIIGIYRDIGREPTIFPIILGKSWAVSGNELIIFDSSNKARVGDYIYCYNTNVVGQQYLKCIYREKNFFTLKLASLLGSPSGASCSYRIDRIKDFSEENIVFRLFPSFKLITYDDFLRIANETSPNLEYKTRKNIRDITLNDTMKTPTIISSHTNYSDVNNFKKASELINSTFKLNVKIKGNIIPTFQHNQTFDHKGKPLKLKYDSSGNVISPNYYDSKYKNKNVYTESLLLGENPSNDPNINDRVWCYDFYGIDINDPNRGPYNSSNIVYRNTNINNNISNISKFKVNGKPVYSDTQQIYDQFGNIVIGINVNNTLNVVRQRIPIQLDNFGRPLKRPY